MNMLHGSLRKVGELYVRNKAEERQDDPLDVHGYWYTDAEDCTLEETGSLGRCAPLMLEAHDGEGVVV